MPPAIALAYASVLKERRAPLAPIYEPRWTAWGGAYEGALESMHSTVRNPDPAAVEAA